MNPGKQTAVQETTLANGPVRVAVIGDFRRDDFRIIIRQIREQTTAIYFDEFIQFDKFGESRGNYDLILLLASGFGQYFSHEIAKLQSRHPTARIVMIAGSLAEGERRTGFLPPEVFRYYWHQWESEALPNLKAFCDRRDSAWGLPPISSEEERFLKTTRLFGRDDDLTFQKLTVDSRFSTVSRSALIVAADPAMREMLADRMTQSDFATETISLACVTALQEKIASLNPAKILLDVVSENFPETLALVRLLKSDRPVSIQLTVFYNAPRPDETRQLVQAGVRRVISKPFF